MKKAYLILTMIFTLIACSPNDRRHIDKVKLNTTHPRVIYILTADQQYVLDSAKTGNELDFKMYQLAKKGKDKEVVLAGFEYGRLTFFRPYLVGSPEDYKLLK